MTDSHPGQTPSVPMASADSRFTLRRLTRWDRSAHLAHLLRLSLSDRHARFQGGMSDAALERYSNQIDWTSTVIFGLFEGTELRGMSELFPFDIAQEGELSVSVESGCQHLGFGRRLVGAVLDTARSQGLRAVHMFFFRDNQGMHSLARAFGAKSRLSGGVLEGIVTFAETERRKRAA
ncbi:GNAT family N-acetyltransferase [Paracoccus aminophilus]|uniref:GCN5-like N-acetyltransferase n=1 Tax=Paracoccus aminophilus JCM 7686 TaxID=1367847 RepID=S5Y1A0_PARAH|nr:GNAT family N-acetyltransferase [Paracoccus aminophilus]AGT11267.1 GCN5-like N-acetyltransferase [Paracoccus aminophilus JCM 7686]